jgi:hypothetical protein
MGILVSCTYRINGDVRIAMCSDTALALFHREGIQFTPMNRTLSERTPEFRKEGYNI